MKSNLHIALLSALIGTTMLSHLAYAETKEEKKLYPLQAYLPVRMSGYVKWESYGDSRQVFGYRDDQNLYYPEKKDPDSSCQDINAHGQFQMAAIQSRLRFEADGPTISRAKTMGAIEADFFGKAGISDIFRLRHAYLQMQWKRVGIIAGQYWHPLYVPGADPRTVSFNTGSPMETFSRNPQLRITCKPTEQTDIMFAATTELDSPSDGPIGSSTTYMRNAIVPMLDAQCKTTWRNHIFGIDVEYKRIVPRLETNEGVKAHESLNSVSAIGYAVLQGERISSRFKFIFAQNPTDVNMIGGYAVHCVNTDDDHRQYTNFNTIAWWNDTEFNYHDKLYPGWFIGIIKNIGAQDTILQNVTDANGTITDQRIFGLGTDIDYVFRISPRLVWKAQNLAFGAEIEYTRAAYGTINSKGDVINTDPVGNVRLLLALFYYI